MNARTGLLRGRLQYRNRRDPDAVIVEVGRLRNNARQGDLRVCVRARPNHPFG